jgi:hypothetical protein
MRVSKNCPSSTDSDAGSLFEVPVNETHLWQGHIRDDDRVESAGGVPQRLIPVAVRVVLIFEQLAAVTLTLPRHGALANTDITLRSNRGGFSSEVPVSRCLHLVLCLFFSLVCSRVGIGLHCRWKLGSTGLACQGSKQKLTIQRSKKHQTSLLAEPTLTKET